MSESTTDSNSDTPTDSVRIAFVCVQNAGRSQMALAFAERNVERRGLGDDVILLTGGTHPADTVHDSVVDAMAEAGFDLSDRTPREISVDELRLCDYVATMGCSTLNIGEVGREVEVYEWDLDDPDGQTPDRVRAIRDTVRRCVNDLLADVEAETQSSSP